MFKHFGVPTRRKAYIWQQILIYLQCRTPHISWCADPIPILSLLLDIHVITLRIACRLKVVLCICICLKVAELDQACCSVKKSSYMYWLFGIVIAKCSSVGTVYGTIGIITSYCCLSNKIFEAFMFNTRKFGTYRGDAVYHSWILL